MIRRIKFIGSKFYSSNGNRMKTTEFFFSKKKKGRQRKDGRAGGSSITTHRTHRSDDPIETKWKCVTSCSRRSDKGSTRAFSYCSLSLIGIRRSKLQQLQPNGWIIMKTTTRYCHPMSMVTALVLLTFIISKSLVFKGVAAEFYIGDYHTFADHSGRNTLKETSPVFHHSNGGIDGDGDRTSNELMARSQPEKQSRRHQHRQGLFKFSTFNPLTPGGTIYLAFIFLIPLTVGKTSFGRAESISKTNGLLERLINKVQQDQQSLYSEMGYIDGNLMFRRAWRDMRDSLAKKLLWLPWRRRFRDIVKRNRNNNINNINSKKKKKKKKKKSWKSWK